RRWPESRAHAGRTAHPQDRNRDQVSRHTGRRLERRTEATMTARNGFDVRRRRCREIEALARYLGAADPDDFDRFLVAWLQALPAPGDRVFAVQNAAIRMGGRITDAKARSLIEEARTTPRPQQPDAWATALRLTYKQRQALGITTIGAIDVRQRQREELR